MVRAFKSPVRLVRPRGKPQVRRKSLRLVPLLGCGEQHLIVITDKQMPWGFILINFGEPADGFAEDVISVVVVYGGHLPDQHIPAIAPKGVPIARHEGDAFAGREAEFLSGGKIAAEAIAKDRAALIFGKSALSIRAKQLHHQSRTATVDDIFSFDHMSMHRRELILPRNQQFFRIAHAAAALQISQAPVAQGEQKQAHCFKITGGVTR